MRLIQLAGIADDEVEVRTFMRLARHAAAVSPHFGIGRVLRQNGEQHPQITRLEIKCRHGQIFRGAFFQCDVRRQ